MFNPGARGSFLYYFLTDKLHSKGFDIGLQADKSQETYANGIWKFHIEGHEQFPLPGDVKVLITIETSTNYLHNWLYLYWQKNILVESPWLDDATNRLTFEKLHQSTHHELTLCENVDVGYFDYVVPFDCLYDLDYLSDLYSQINNRPSNNMQLVKEINNINNVSSRECKIITNMVCEERAQDRFDEYCFRLLHS
jgi:hypothetical protein